MRSSARAAWAAAVWWLAGPVECELLDQAQAIVGDSVITTSSLLLAARDRGLPAEPGPARQAALQALLEELITFELQALGARRAGLAHVTLEEADAELARRHPGWSDPARRAQILRERGQREPEARDQVGKELQVRRHIEQRFRASVSVQLEEVERAYREVYAPRWREQGQAVPPLLEARGRIEADLIAERVRGLVESWTEELRRTFPVEVLPLPEE